MPNDYASVIGVAVNPALAYPKQMVVSNETASVSISTGSYGGQPPPPPVPQMSLRDMMEQLHVVMDDHEKILHALIQLLSDAGLVKDMPTGQPQPGNVAVPIVSFPVGRVIMEDVSRVEQWTSALRQIHERLAL